MTRSVEIPDETVRKALDGYCSVPTYGTYQGQFDAMRAALKAALPYLAPAEPVAGAALDFRQAAEEANVRMGQPRDWALPAPAGDGGLREALERLVERKVEQSNGVDTEWSTVTVRQLRDLLAAHPAAPAVPQPAHANGPAVRAIASEFMARYKGASEPDEFALSAAEAGLLSALPHLAVPQPVDREALYVALLETWNDMAWDEHNWNVLAQIGKMTDAVLAVLAGEQEQVER